MVTELFDYIHTYAYTRGTYTLFRLFLFLSLLKRHAGTAVVTVKAHAEIETRQLPQNS